MVRAARPKRLVANAVAELKKQAAKVGANAVVLGSRSTEAQVVGIPSYGTQGGTMITSSDTEVVQGVAVFVENQLLFE